MVAGICIAGAGKLMAIAATAFSLSWVHSVEKTEWREDYVLRGNGFQLVEARVRGSGAGMEPGENARLEDGWWIWNPDAPAAPEMNLAASGATVSPWRLCHAGGCVDLGTEPGDGISIRPCVVEEAGG